MSLTIIPARNKSNNPKISICIANYNGACYIGQCIRSILNQDIEIEIEIIVHDDASTDDSVSFLKNHFPSVEILASKRNRGFCVSNNRMAIHARGEYLLFLNNDAKLRFGAIEALLGCAKSQNNCGIIGLPQYAMHDGSLIDRGYLLDIFLNPIPRMADGKAEVAAVTGACLWISKRVWDRIGGFPELFESVAEDIYLCCAARILGYSVVCLGGPGFDHWVGRNLGGGKIVKQKLSTTLRRRSLSERNKTYAILSTYPFLFLMAIFPFHIIYLTLEGLIVSFLIRRKELFTQVYLPIPFHILKNIEKIRSLRVDIQKKRNIKTCDFFARFRWTPWKIRMFFRYGLPKVQ